MATGTLIYMADSTEAGPRLPADRVLSLHHLSVLRATPAELVDAAAAAGFGHCGIRLVSPDTGNHMNGIVEDRRARRDLVRRCAERGVAVLDIEAVWLRPASDVSALHPALEAAAELGARHILTVAHDHERSRLVDNLGRLADVAAQFGLKVPLEFITYTAVPDLATAWRLVQEVDRDNVAVLIDTLQFFRAGADFAGLADIPADRVPYVQICDGRAESPHGEEALRQEARTDRLCPGEGDLDVVRLIAALPPQVPLSVEAPTLALAHHSPTDAAHRYAASLARLLDQARPDSPHAALRWES